MAVRDRNFVSTKYEQIWGAVRDFVVQLQQSENPEFESLLRRALAFSWRLNSSNFCAPDVQKELPFLFGPVEVKVNELAYEHIWRDLVAGEVLKVVHEDCDVLAELGAGWSTNIFNLWLRGAPPKARYFGCELTNGGRAAATALARSRKDRSFSAPAFDWDFPDFSFVPQDAKRVTFYSSFSIEQIPELKLELIKSLLAATSKAVSVHGLFLEPVGWLYPELSPDRGLYERTRNYAFEKNYNRNLRQLMEQAQSEGLIRILSVKVDAFGQATNPATAIHWCRA